MPVLAIDLLEVVDVQQQHRERRPVALTLGLLPLQFVVHRAPVGAAGERVGGGLHGHAGQ